MRFAQRAFYGALSGLGGTLALSGFRETLSRIGAVEASAPEQVVERLEELGLVEDLSPEARRILVVGAHLAYGIGTGFVLGVLRRERSGLAEEVAVGSALGILAWGVGWSSWLPLAGVHLPPWKQRSIKVLLPILDHGVYGAAWGFSYKVLGPDQG